MRRDPDEYRPHVLAVLAFGIGVAAVVGFCVETLPSIAAAYVALGIGLIVGRWW